MMGSSKNKTSFQETQLTWTAHLRAPLLSPAPTGVEDRRLGIYRDLVFNNIESFLSGSFPILHSVVSEENWLLLVREFIKSHECDSPYFLEISQEFLSFLNEQQPTVLANTAFALELAHYEWAELALDVSPESFPDDIKLKGDLLDDRLIISPLAWRLSYQFPVHKIGPEFKPDQPPDQATYLIVYRDRDEQVKFIESNSVTICLLQLLEEGSCSAREALCQIAVEIGHPDVDFIVASGLDTLKQLQSLSIICGFHK